MREAASGERSGMMNPKALYVGLCVVGTVAPYWEFMRFVLDRSPAGPSFLEALFANGVSGFFAMDVIVSSIALVIFMRTESRRLGITRRWVPIVGLLLVGVSLALPLFLYMRETHLEKAA
jgi:hypothetical protein